MTKNYTKIYLILALLLGFSFGYAQSTLTWNGGGATNDFSDGANWVGGVAPISGDNVIFNGTSSKNCTIDLDIDLNDFTIQSGYNGTVDGTTGNARVITVNNFSQASGTFISTDDQLSVTGDLTLSGGTFTHNSGIVTIFVSSGGTNNISGAFSFNELQITHPTPVSGTALRTMNFGTSATTRILTFNGTNRNYAFQGNITVTRDLVNLGSYTGAISGANTGTITFSGAGPITMTGTNGQKRTALPNVVINTTGNLSMSSQLSVSGTWAVSNIGSYTAGTSTVNFHGATTAVTSGTTSTKRAYFDNVFLSGGSTLNLGTAHAELKGNLTNNGTLGANTCLLLFSGTGSQAVTSNSAVVTTINAISKSNTGSLTFGTKVNLLDSIRISGGAVTTANNLTLKSTSALKARVAEISGGGSLSGNLTVETFIPGGLTDWAVLGVSGVNGPTFNSWYGAIPMAIEGSATGVTSTASQYFESVQGWNESDAYGYDTTITVTTPITPGKGYWLYVGTGLTTSADITTTVTGSPMTGTQNLSLSNSAQAGDCLLANPFASPISWDRIVAGNPGVTSGAIYIYNADLGVTTSYAGGVSSHGTGAKSTIPMGQGFYVEATGFTPLSITEAMKVSNNTASNPLIKASGATSSSNVGNVVRLKITDGYFSDETAIRFHGSATNGFDVNLDAKKYFDSPGYAGYASTGPWTKRTTISTQSGNKDYSINSLPYALTSNAVIPVLAKVYATGQHTISALDLQNLAPGTCVTLKDKLLNITHNLAASDYVCSISDTTSTARFELTICANLTAGINEATSFENVFVKQDNIGVYVDLNFDKSTKATITAINMLGQSVMNDMNVECIANKYYLNLSNIKEQIIVVSVNTEEKRYTQKVYIPAGN